MSQLADVRTTTVLAILLVASGVSCREAPSETAAGVTSVIGSDGQSLGSIRLPTSCSEGALPMLEQAMALLHHMTYLEADSS